MLPSWFVQIVYFLQIFCSHLASMLTLGSKQAKPLSLKEGNVNAVKKNRLYRLHLYGNTVGCNLVTPIKVSEPHTGGWAGPKGWAWFWIRISIGNTGHETEGGRRNNEWLHKSTSNIITRHLTSWGGRERTTKITSLSSGGAVGGAISNQGRIRGKGNDKADRKHDKNTKSRATKTQEVQKNQEPQGWPPSHDSTEESKREDRLNHLKLSDERSHTQHAGGSNIRGAGGGQNREQSVAYLVIKQWSCNQM